MLFSQTYRSQLYATVVASIIAFGYGISQAWPSPVLPLLQSVNTPFEAQLTIEEISWIAAITQIGGMLGTPVFGWSSEKFGRKNTLLVAALPQILSWIIVGFSSSAFHLYVARFLVGFGGTGIFVVIPCYVAEISTNDVRGTLGSIMMVIKNFGIVVGYTINSYLNYYTVPVIVTAVLVAFLIGFMSIADSPKHLMTQNRPDEAVAALKYFRGYKKSDQTFSKEFEHELAGLKNCGQSTEKLKDEKLTMKDFCSKSAIMSILIGVVIIYLEVNGYAAIQNYSETIFRDAGSTLSPALSTVLLGVILLVGSYSSTLLVEIAGRKILMIISAMGCGISLSFIAAYSYLKEGGFDVAPYSWVPLLFLSTFILLGSMGVFSLHIVITTEVLDQKIRGVVMTFLVFESWTVTFLTVKYFPILLGIIGMHGCMLIFAITCFAGALFVLFVVPETKGKSIEDIVEELGGKKLKKCSTEQ